MWSKRVEAIVDRRVLTVQREGRRGCKLMSIRNNCKT